MNSPKTASMLTLSEGLDFQSNTTEDIVTITKNGKYTISIEFTNSTKYRLVIRISPNTTAHLKIFSSKHTNAKKTHIQYHLGQNSTLNVSSSFNNKSRTKTSHQYTTTLDRDATLNYHELVTPGDDLTLSQTYRLVGSGAHVSDAFLYFGSAKDSLTLDIRAKHLAPNTISDLHSKGISNAQANTKQTSTIYISKDAPNSSGYESGDVLIVSNQARASATPNLEIYNHNVTCSHGQTLGKIDEEILSYLTTRGLDEKEAKRLIVQGFFGPQLRELNDKTLTDQLNKKIEGMV